MVKKNSRKLMLIVIALFLSITLKAFSQSGDKPGPPKSKDIRKTCRLQIEVTTGNPPEKVEGADVHIVSEEDGARYMKDARTNREGIVSLDHVPQGRILIQVRVRGHDTVGDRYTLTKDNETIKFNLRGSGDQNNRQ